MGFLRSAAQVVAAAAARVMMPPDPPDITRWCEENIEFSQRAPIPGKFRIALFPFLREIHEVLSPEHPCREVTVRKSAQIGGTVSILQPMLAAWHEYVALDSLVVHPTTSSATEWVNNKWLPMRRDTPSLIRMFGSGRGDNVDNAFNQETVDRTGSLKVASAGSPDDLAGTSRRLVAMDDLSKFEMNDKGDPEAMAISRASAFEDAKILRMSTPQVRGTCRVTKAYERSDQRQFHLPCPHCDTYAPLTWENFRASIDPERLHAAHFTCDACGAVIGHGDKRAMVARGRWLAGNPRGDHPGFDIWRAYAPQRDWASIAVEYAQVMGWTGLSVSASTEAVLRSDLEAATEQTFFNDVLGRPYEQASRGPDWTALRDRAAGNEFALDRRLVPARGVILTAGVDCQGDRTEVQIVAHGPNFQRWVLEYIVIPHCITEEACWADLDAVLTQKFRTDLGRLLVLDMLAIDGGAFTDAVWLWAKRWPWTQVIIVKGASTQNGPVMQPQKFERRDDGKAKRLQKRAFILNVSQMKADFYGWLEKADPAERGYVAFGRGLGDEYYRQVTSEVRVLTRNKAGVVTSKWDLVEPTRRNEGLDTLLYAEAAARRKGWASKTAEQWAVLEDERGGPPPEPQGDLFDAQAQGLPAPKAVPSAPAAKEKNEPVPDRGQTRPSAGDWLGRHAKKGDWI